MDLHPAALLSLLKATEMLFCCALPSAETHLLVEFPMRLVRTLGSHARSRKTAYHIGIFISAYALSQRDYLGGTAAPTKDRASRAERAMDMVEHHTSLADKARSKANLALVFGLLELLRYCRPGEAVDADYDMLLSSAIPLLRHVHSPGDSYVYTIPKSLSDSMLGEQISDILAYGIYHALGKPQISSPIQNEARVGAYLEMLCSQPRNPPSVQAYAFVVESLCRTHSTRSKRICSYLLMSYDLEMLPEDSIYEVLHNRNILDLLFRTAKLSASRDPRTSLFAMSQLWQHITHIIQYKSDIGQSMISGLFPDFAKKNGIAWVLENVCKEAFLDTWLPS